jgi:hypothetical protein
MMINKNAAPQYMKNKPEIASEGLAFCGNND